MKIYNTDQLDDIKDPERRQIVYNGFDSMLTLEIFDILKPYAKDGTYRYSKRMQGPAMTLMRRGIKVNAQAARLLIEGDPDSTDEKCKLGLRARAFKLGGLGQRLKGEKNPKREWYVADENAVLQRLAKAAWGKTLNYNSEKQMKAFFYDALMVKPIYINKAGKRTVSTGREALEKLLHLETRAIPFATIVIKLREFAKMEDVLTKSLSPEGRWRCSYNVVGTDTWRWSSKKHPLGDGSNNQNIDPELRNVFEADPGMVLINCDQQGAEARVVAYKSGDENYIKAVESGDVHTMVCSMTWKFEPKRELAEREFYRKKSYRDISKKLTHGTSYDGKAKTLAKQGRVPLDLVEDFQRIFGRVFPGIKDWQIWVKERIETDGSLTTLMGMTRKFWGRRSDDATHRAAIAFEPQNTVGVMTALGLYKLWSTYEPDVQILQNGHDAVLCQVPIERLDELLPLILECLKTPVEVTDIKGNTRLMTIPWDAAVGFNWGKYVKADPIKGTPENNLRGLREWKDKSKLPSSLIQTALQATSTPPCQTPT